MILLIDNYDSFSYNLYQMTGAIEPDIRVIRNDAFTVDEIWEMNPSGIILSPGPGRPEDAGVCMDIVRSFQEAGNLQAGRPEDADALPAGKPEDVGVLQAGRSEDADALQAGKPEEAGVLQAGRSGNRRNCRIPVLGVCLGHQSICAAFGATVSYAKELMHGKTSLCRIDTASPIFEGLEETEQVGRYHSLAAIEKTMPDCLKITARTEDGEIMAVGHRTFPIYGIQFHPESILTPNGEKILENFVRLSRHACGAASV